MQTLTSLKQLHLFTGLVAATLLAGCGALPGTPTDQAAAKRINVFTQATTWQALSRTASGITGDVTLTDTQLTFANGVSMAIEPTEHNRETGQTLFRVISRTNPPLLNGNLLCGNKPVDYLLVQITGDVPGQSDMQLMAYYYPETLRLSQLPLKDGNDLSRQMCALYTYVR